MKINFDSFIILNKAASLNLRNNQGCPVVAGALNLGETTIYVALL